jgi:hypothetical protein
MLDLVILRAGDAVPIPEVTLALVVDHGFLPAPAADINVGYEIKLRAGTNSGYRPLAMVWGRVLFDKPLTVETPHIGSLSHRHRTARQVRLGALGPRKARRGEARKAFLAVAKSLPRFSALDRNRFV